MSIDPPQKAVQTRRLVIEHSVYYSVLPSSGKPQALLLALHGYGQSCQRFIGAFAPLCEEDIAVAAPQAPNQFYISWNPRRVGFTWLTRYQRDQSIRDFIAYMHRLYDALATEPQMYAKKVVLLGFSQGVSMAYRLALYGDLPVAGLVAVGADLPPDVEEKFSEMPRIPVLLAHSPEDEVVPEAKCDAAEQVLRAHHVDVERLSYRGGHRITDELVDEVGRWISRKILVGK